MTRETDWLDIEQLKAFYLLIAAKKPDIFIPLAKLWVWEYERR